jgi:hypothetical protein
MDSRTATAIQRLAQKRAAPATLEAVKPPAQILASRSLGRNPAASSTGGAIESPLTEIARSLHATQAISSEGLFVWSVPETITFSDAAGRPVELIFAAPV